VAGSQVNARHFEIFLALITGQGLADAARKLGVSQPAISKTIRLLERETGVALFARVSGRLQPTEAAQRLLPYVQRALGQLDAAKRVAYELGNSGERLVIAAGAPALMSLVPLAVEALRRVRPELTVEIRAETTPNVITLVSNHEADIGIATTPAQSIDARIVQKCETRQICEHPLVVVLPGDHRLAGRAAIRTSDLAGETIIGLPEDSPTTVLVQAAFDEAGLALRLPLVVGNSVGVCALVRQGLGVGLINPLQLSLGLFPDIIARPFRPRIPLRTCVYQSSFKPLSPPAAELLRQFETAAARLR